MKLPRFLNIFRGEDVKDAEIPAHGEFPAGIRVAVVKDVPRSAVPWEILAHPAEKLYSFRQLDDVDAKGPVFQLPDDHVAALVTQVGVLLHPKKVAAIRMGMWLEGWEPGTFFTATEGDDTYTATHAGLIRYLLSGAQPLLSSYAAQDPPQKTDQVPADGGSDGRRA